MKLKADNSSKRRARAAQRKESANQGPARNPSDGKNVSSGAHVRAMFARHLVYFVKRPTHHHLELRIHFRFGPEEALQVLHTFEVADSYAARVRKNIRNHRDALASQNFICVRSGRP